MKIKFSQNAPKTWYPANQEHFPPKIEDVQEKTLQNQWMLSMAGFDADGYYLDLETGKFYTKTVSQMMKVIGYYGKFLVVPMIGYCTNSREAKLPNRLLPY
jgi:hypothetical protein